MSLDPNKLYGIAQSLAEVAKDEYGENGFIGFSKILKVCKSNHFAELLLSRVSTPTDKVKLVFITNLIITGRYKKETILSLSRNLYLYVIDFYDNSEEIKQECSNCEGSGDEECSRCDGTGNLDCGYCDGEGKVECYECSGEGTEECRYCDGKGTETETEEDDEGDEVEVEVECTGCSGSGTEECRNCGGQGDFECSECNGKGYENCEDCGGYGSHTCGYCDGYGEEDSGEYKYNIARVTYITLGNKLSEFEDQPMLLSDFEEIDGDNDKVPFSFTVNKRSFSDDDITKEERQEMVGLDDDFVEVVDAYKLENYPYEITF
jgi:hypothetical protein